MSTSRAATVFPAVGAAETETAKKALASNIVVMVIILAVWCGPADQGYQEQNEGNPDILKGQWEGFINLKQDKQTCRVSASHQ